MKLIDNLKKQQAMALERERLRWSTNPKSTDLTFEDAPRVGSFNTWQSYKDYLKGVAFIKRVDKNRAYTLFYPRFSSATV